MFTHTGRQPIYICIYIYRERETMGKYQILELISLIIVTSLFIKKEIHPKLMIIGIKILSLQWFLLEEVKLKMFIFIFCLFLSYLDFVFLLLVDGTQTDMYDIYMYLSLHIYVCVCVVYTSYICVCVCVCAFVYIYIYIHTHIYVCVYGYIYIYIYIYIKHNFLDFFPLIWIATAENKKLLIEQIKIL